MLPIETLPNTMTVTRTQQTGRGVTTTTIATGVPCSFDSKSRITATPEGPVLVDWKLVTFRGTLTVNPGDRVTINSTEYTVREVTPVHGGNGQPVHTQLTVW